MNHSLLQAKFPTKPKVGCFEPSGRVKTKTWAAENKTAGDRELQEIGAGRMTTGCP
jgi:hypothetical protein